MSALTRWMDRAWYPQHDRNWNDLIFRQRVLAAISPKSRLLDLGAGAGIVQQMNFRGLARKVCGIDLDPRVADNPLLDEGRVANAESIPYGNDNFDVAIADNVLEHLEAPVTVFKEVARVLVPGGLFLFKTPNKWHYMPTIARLTPHGFHQFVNRLRGRADPDTFPTRYRANSRQAIRRLALQSGFQLQSTERIEGRPEYLRMFAPTDVFGTAYERFVNASECLAPFRILLIGILRKPRT
jgi:SAM-dependent methyltransferase